MAGLNDETTVPTRSMERVNFFCPSKIVTIYEKAVKEGFFPNRSEAFRHALIEFALQCPTFQELREKL